MQSADCSAVLKQNESCSMDITKFIHLCFLFCTCFHDGVQAARSTQHKAVCLCLEQAGSFPIEYYWRHACDAEAHALLLL